MNSVYFIHGLKRSGNHAIVNWLSAENSFRFFNNIVPMARILTGERSMPEPIGLDRWLRSKRRFWFFGRVGSNDRLLLSLEDHKLDFRPILELPESTQHILILRDPRNLFASRIRKAHVVNNASYAREPGPLFDRAIDRWKEHAREFLGDTNHLPNKTAIYFNRWFVSQPYRKQICERLGLRFSDKGLSKVTDHGGGSSFDRSAYDNRASEMDVLHRAKNLSEQEREMLELVLRDPEVNELHQRIETAARET
jgi:hypothetical protein